MQLTQKSPCNTVFRLQNIKLSSMKAKAAEDLADEGDVAGAAIVEARNKFLTQVTVHAHITFEIYSERFPW